MRVARGGRCTWAGACLDVGAATLLSSILQLRHDKPPVIIVTQPAVHSAHVQHYSSRGRAEEHPTSGIDITFTATTSASGSLLVGSSREFSGWGTQPCEAVVQAIMDRAALFLPHLKGAPLPQGPDVRVGLRPFATGGAPMIGPVPGAQGEDS